MTDGTTGRYVLSDVQRRRRWTPEEKVRSVYSPAVEAYRAKMAERTGINLHDNIAV